MAEPRNDWGRPERYEDTVDPRNPPNSVINPHVRTTAFWAYLGPILAMFIIIGIALIYWMTR